MAKRRPKPALAALKPVTQAEPDTRARCAVCNAPDGAVGWHDADGVFCEIDATLLIRRGIKLPARILNKRVVQITLVALPENGGVAMLCRRCQIRRRAKRRAEGAVPGDLARAPVAA